VFYKLSCMWKAIEYYKVTNLHVMLLVMNCCFFNVVSCFLCVCWLKLQRCL